jgi:hypothetical protein
MNKKKIFIMLLIIIVIMPTISSQSLSIGVKFFGLSFHPYGANNAKLMQLKLDNEGVFVLNIGATLNIELYIWKDIVSLKFVQGLYRDCIGQFAGFTHFGIRGKIQFDDSNSINGGIGPTIIFRKNWYDVNGYDDSFSFFNGKPGDMWQWKFIIYGGEFEYNHVVNKKIYFSTSFVPGYPDLMNLSIGLRYKCY